MASSAKDTTGENESGASSAEDTTSEDENGASSAGTR